MAESDAFRKACLLSPDTLTYKNREVDNGFLELSIDETVKKTVARGYTLLGIGKSGWINKFFDANDDICLVFLTRSGNTKWCHISRVYYHHLLAKKWGREEAERIYVDVLTSLRAEL